MKRFRAIVRYLVAALVCVAPVAHATGDAGTQSVFAYGAGNRAAAMGGAFVAAVDDASSMIWNPAGLGLVSRFELQAVQSGDLGLGMTESYAAFALPSWRWGAAGVSMRYFGVTGIEQRNDRNVLLNDNLSDQQLEMAVGYGRAFGDAVSLGGAVKLQHQSLAGFSGSGLGLDLGLNLRPAAIGLRAPWAQSFSWGLGLRNALEPAVRLDRESVADPMALRTGLAWRTLTNSGGGLLTEVDLSRSNGVAPRLHAGLEYRLFPAAALRVGMNDRVLTAGTGLKLGGLTLDYAFEDAQLSPAHRAGLTLKFGATTSDSRAAYRQREDAKVERRLAEAFRQRQDEQVAELFKRANLAREHGDFDGALDALALLNTLAPGRADATQLELRCVTDKARKLEQGEDFAAASLLWERALTVAPGDSLATVALSRCRTASDRRAKRSDELRAEFARAMDAFASEDFVAARKSFADVLRAQPADAEAGRMLARTDQALTRRAERLSALAMRSVRAGSLDAAQAAIAECQALTKDAPGLLAAIAALAHARELATAADAQRAMARMGIPTAVAAAPAARQMTDREAEELYQRGLAALRAQRPDDAMRYWELVWSSRPGYREVAGLLKREYLTRGMEAFAAGRLDEAMTQWERVLRVDPADDRARGYLARAQEQRTRSREILGGTP